MPARACRSKILVCYIVTFASLGSCLLLAGCGGGTLGPTPTPQITVSGNAQARLGSTVQLTAAVSNIDNQAVTWQVNGVAGGSTSTGTISASGLYTPPTTIPSPNTVTITAVSQTTPAVSGLLTESILNPIPTVTSAVATQTIPSSTYLLDVLGTGFVSGTQLQLSGSSVTTDLVSSTELQATVTLPAGTISVSVGVVNPDPGSAPPVTANAQVQSPKASVTAAARLLDQATFGPTYTDIQHVQKVGLSGYLTEQFAIPTTTLPDISTPPPAACTNNTVPCEQSEWWQTVLTGNDQLRQRVAFALSEMFVISTNSVNARAVTTYHNTLANDAFVNFLTIMKDVTLSPGMGAYLNMLNSKKPGVVNGVPQIANENYARELMQLFSTGLNMLNQDGTPQLDGSGNPIPVYTEAQVQAFAKAFTGWTYATSTGGSPANFPNNTPNYDAPMAAVESAHDTSTKTLLNTTLPSGQTSAQNLDGALSDIFNHPNVGPFVCRQLIQHLVASDPSPAYVSRVAEVFANNGSGVRGDMKAVITAILLDQDARAGDTGTTFDGGHLREPMLYMTNVMRALGFINTDANGYYSSLSNYTGSLGERPYASGSVFNFFPPDYVIPGTTHNAPEFGQENTASTILRLTMADNLVFNKISSFKVDLSASSALGMMASNPANLVDTLGLIFMHRQMPTQMRTAIVNHISTLTDPAQRVRVATYLVITSSLYKVEH